MTEIYLIRHTQAEGNLYQMLQGHWDGDVTTLGLKQIAALAERFRPVKVDAVYSSDLYRAMVTATAVTRWGDLPLRTDQRLREINVGPWETSFFGNAFYAEHELFQCFVADPDKYYYEGSETYAQVGDRAFAALEDIAASHEGETLAVVSHGVAIRCILSRITGTELKAMPLCGNTGVSHLYYENGRFTADYINDVSHLPQEPGGERKPSLRHEYVDPSAHREYYQRCYEDAWLAAHGSLEGYRPEPYYDSALEHYAADRESVCIIYDWETPAGLVDLDTRRGAHAGYGWISLLYLGPEYRGRGLGIQLLARAIVRYEALGRTALRLHVSDDNGQAMAFYKNWGFKPLSYEPRDGHRLYLMEKKLGGRIDVR